MQKYYFILLMIFSGPAHAHKKTVSECAKDLSRQVFEVNSSKAQELCKSNKQKTIDCAIQYYRGNKLGKTFDDAISECSRDEER